jgi:hypothetical protein
MTTQYDIEHQEEPVLSDEDTSLTAQPDEAHQDEPVLSDTDASPPWSPPILRVAPCDATDLEELIKDYVRWLIKCVRWLPV